MRLHIPLCTAICHLAVASASWLPDNFQYWAWQGATTWGKRLYVDGGEVWYKPAGSSNASSYHLNTTLSFDLTKSWKLDSVEPNSSPRDPNYAESKRPILVADGIHRMIYSYGGMPYDSGTEAAVWAFATQRNGNVQWQKKASAGDKSSFSSFTSPGLSISAQTNTTSYSLGGVLSSTIEGLDGLQNQPAIEGMAAFDYENNVWSNISTLSSTNGTYGSAGLGMLGEAVYMRDYGEEGVLVFVGGGAPATSDWKEYESLVPMSNVTIFDIHTKKWYHQAATGTIPQPRGAFCSVRAASDTKTHEFVIFGGTQGKDLDDDTYNDLGLVYILTLPAFHWIAAPSSSAPQRSAHHCELIQGSQMLVIGGAPLGKKASDEPGSDPWPNGLGLFDLTELKWKDSYSSDSKYRKPDVVQDYYSSAKSQYPDTWDDPELEAIINPDARGNDKPIRKGSGSKTGAIVGGVVGGVIGVGIMVTGIFWIRRRRRQEDSTGGKHEEHKKTKSFGGPPQQLDAESAQVCEIADGESSQRNSKVAVNLNTNSGPKNQAPVELP